MGSTHANSDWVGFIVDKWRTFRKIRAAKRELAELDSSEVANIAADLGISAADLHTLVASGECAADLLGRRLAALGINPDRIGPAVMRDLQLHCVQCKSKTLCEHELEDKPPTATWPKYCPNEQTIDTIKNFGAKAR